jgi:hypothetical protein
VGLSNGVVVGTSLVVLGAGASDGLTEGAGFDEVRSGSTRDELSPDGVGVAAGCREALSWLSGVDSAEGLSFCLRTAA